MLLWGNSLLTRPLIPTSLLVCIFAAGALQIHELHHLRLQHLQVSGALGNPQSLLAAPLFSLKPSSGPTLPASPFLNRV